eukprot:TRINITY_DN7694_c0_g1_i2.p1 TRINITY_DN7694_c0_g1~~TRINITY_DN7694_c0_g1_i2.p1  ORF type:complete len:185 (+),score=15.29 TRINITY_DN7694_c0_g1_i2:2-556(+)
MKRKHGASNAGRSNNSFGTSTHQSSIGSATGTTCGVCTGDQPPPKYRCPNCRLPYCSVACFKLHKEMPCIKVEAPPIVHRAPTAPLKPLDRRSYATNSLVNEEEDIKVPLGLLKRLETSPEVRRQLEDSRLRALLTTLCSNDNKYESYENLRSSLNTLPEFAEFANEVLIAIGVRDGDTGQYNL